jgi:hypothetical protein
LTLTLELPAELETELAAEAERLRLPLAEYVLRVLAIGRLPNPMPRTGAEVVAYWEREGLLGTRSDITDPSGHARALRAKAEKRERP